MGKKKSKKGKPKTTFSLDGNCDFEFTGATVEASTEAEAIEIFKRDLENAIESVAGMTCGFSVDNVRVEVEMEERCAVCGTEQDDLNQDAVEIVRGLAPLDYDENAAIGAPFLDGEFVCPKCMDPKNCGKQAQKFRRYYMKIFRNYPNAT